MVLGSSSVHAAVRVGTDLRWVALVVLAGIAVALAVRTRGAGADRSLRLVLALGGWVAVLSVLSTAWSVDPKLTFGRGGSFALLFVTAGALALAARSRPALVERLLLGSLAATVAVVLAGVLLLPIAHGDAVQVAANVPSPTRFRGLGENPDTAAMLEGLMVPVALWFVVVAQTARRRGAAIAALIVLLAAISASGSRGGLLGAFAGGIALSLLLPGPMRRRLALSAAVCVAVAGAAAGTRLPKPVSNASTPSTATAPSQSSSSSSSSSASPPASPPPTPQVGQAVGPAESRYGGRLQDELFRVYAGNRTLFTSSGRLQAWYTAIQQADERPLLGFGFGTEDHVFIDRVYNFEGTYIENSFIGFYMQLGAFGLASVLALLLALAFAVGRGRADPRTALLAAVVIAGLALWLVQSYAYSVGNVATVTFWIAAFAIVAVRRDTGRAPSSPREEGIVVPV